jgi:hypothetical protein
MRKLIFGLLGFAALGFGALSAQPAEAQPYYRGYGYGAPVVEYRYARPRPRPVVRVEYRSPRRAYRAYPAYPAYRPAYRPVRTVQRCFVQPRRVWNGYRWVRRPVEVCRTVRRPGYRF